MRSSGSRRGLSEKSGAQAVLANPRSGCVPPTVAFRLPIFTFSCRSAGPLPSAAVASSFPPAELPARLSSSGDVFSSQGGTPGEAREATGEGDRLEQAPAVFGPPYLSLSPVPARCMTGRKQPAVFSGPASLWFVFVVLVDRDLRGAPGCTVGRF